MADAFKYRIDHHGSLVRPPELRAARERRAAGEISADELRAVEDRAVQECVRAQRKLGLSAVTDGEFRRTDTRESTTVTDDVAFVAALTRVPAKATLPAPSWLGGHSAEIRAEIERLIAQGVRYIQLTNPDYPLDGALADAIALDSHALAVQNKPADVRIGLCPAWQAPDAVDVGAAEELFARVPVDRWILPFLHGTKGEADLLRAVPADRDVCLGIVDPAADALEEIGTILARMDTAFALRDPENLAVSPSTGFRDGTADNQWRKLVHVETIARMCWGNEL